MDITILGFPGCFYFGLCNVKRKESEKGERERRRGGGVGIDDFFFWGTEFMVVKTYIELSIYIIQQLDESISKSDIIYI